MLNCKVPFNEMNPSLIYELQMGQKYQFKHRDPSYADVKSLIKRLLQPEPKNRPSIDVVLAHNWLVKDTSPEGKFIYFFMRVSTDRCVMLNTELKDINRINDSPDVNKMSEQKISWEDIMKTDDNISEDIMKNENEASGLNEEETSVTNENDSGAPNENETGEPSEKVKKVDNEVENVIAALTGN